MSRFRKTIKLTNNNLRKNSLICASFRELLRILWKNRISKSLRCRPNNSALISLTKNRCINVRIKKCLTKVKRWRKCGVRTRKISNNITRKKTVKLEWSMSKWYPWPKRTQIIYQKQLQTSKKKQCCETPNQTFFNERIVILSWAKLGVQSFVIWKWKLRKHFGGVLNSIHKKPYLKINLNYLFH